MTKKQKSSKRLENIRSSIIRTNQKINNKRPIRSPLPLEQLDMRLGFPFNHPFKNRQSRLYQIISGQRHYLHKGRLRPMREVSEY